MTQNIKLNFLAIKPQKFNFTIWRRIFNQSEKDKQMKQRFYKTRLPKEYSDEQYLDYLVSFKPEPEFEEFLSNSNLNNQLTLRFLFESIFEKIKNGFNNEEYEFKMKFGCEIKLFFKGNQFGKEYISIQPYFLKSQGIFGLIIDFGFKKNLNIPFNREIQRLSLSLDNKYQSNCNYYLDKHDKIKLLFSQIQTKIFPIIIFDKIYLTINSEFENLLYIDILHQKNYIFSEKKLHNSQYNGLLNYGPYSNLSQPLKIYLIARNKDKYLLEEIDNALHGTLQQKSFYDFFKSNVDVISLSNIDDYNLEILQKIENSLIRAKKDSKNEKIVFPIIIIKKDSNEIYNELKLRLLENGISVQFITKELMNNKESFKWAIPNLFLQIFCKNGGIPWIVQASNKDCLIIGIGQSHKREGIRIKKYFSYSVCTESSGLYKKFSILGEHEELSEYLKEFRDNIKREFKDEIKNYSKIVLHLPFKINWKEIDALKEAFESLTKNSGRTDIKLVFLRINVDNKYMGFADSNSRIPFESTFVKLSHIPYSYLVWFEGTQYNKGKINKRISGPVFVEFFWSNIKNLTENDRISYLQDLINLSGANWRGFNAKNLPISLFYCKIIAKMVSNFPEHKNDLISINNPWFL